MKKSIVKKNLTALYSIEKISWILKSIFEKLRIRLENSFFPSYSSRLAFSLLYKLPPRKNSKGDTDILTFIILNSNHSIIDINATMDSIIKQTVPFWRAIVFLGEIDLPSLEQSTNAKIEFLHDRQEFSQVLENIKSKYFCLLSPGDVIHPSFIEYLLDLESDILYFDQSIYSPHNTQSKLFLKPDWSPELWLNLNILYGCAYNTEYIKKIFHDHPDQWLAWAVNNTPKIAHIPKPLISSSDFPWNDPQQRQSHLHTIKDYFDIQKIPLPKINIRPNGSIEYDWQISQKMVSIIILNRDSFKIITRCLETIYFNTNYPSYELIVVDDHSQDPEVLSLYQQYITKRNNFKVVQGERPFNFSRSCNLGVRHASGDYLLFLNNDTEIIHDSWLRNLVGVAGLPGVGAVGAKLLYPNGRVQHAGVVIGLEGHAAHVFQGVKDDPYTPYGHVDWMRNVSAVTAACMMVRKEVFWEVGGFDEQFQIAFGDIDFCLRLGDAGYRIVYTPDVQLIHHESKTRGKYIPPHDIRAKTDYFIQKVIAGDPYYHPQLSRAYRIPTIRREWEQDPAERLRNIIKYLGN